MKAGVGAGLENGHMTQSFHGGLTRQRLLATDQETEVIAFHFPPFLSFFFLILLYSFFSLSLPSFSHF